MYACTAVLQLAILQVKIFSYELGIKISALIYTLYRDLYITGIINSNIPQPQWQHK